MFAYRFPSGIHTLTKLAKLAKLARITRVRNLTFRRAQETCSGSNRLKETHYNLPRRKGDEEKKKEKRGKREGEREQYPAGLPDRRLDWILSAQIMVKFPPIATSDLQP